MLSLILSFALHLAPQDVPKPPSEERVAEVILEIKKSHKHGTTEEQARLLIQASEVPAKDVALLLSKSLNHKEPKLVDAAIQGLRWMQHPEALKALQTAHGRNKALLKDPAKHVALIKAIGQHAELSSIKLLSDDLFGYKDARIVEARILGLGMIRHKDSLEALMRVMSGNAPNQVRNSMATLRTSLILLTGIDKGLNREAWLSWWRANDKDFAMAPRSRFIPRKILDRWARYWGLDYETDRPTKREDRGL